MGEVFDKTLSGGLRSAYHEVLKDEPDESLKQAAKTWLRKGKRFPYPADLIGSKRATGSGG